MSPNDAYDLPSPYIDAVQYRKDAAPKPKEIRPLLTREPLPETRERKLPPPPKKKRKQAVPTTPALAFDPKCNRIPTGRQDPPISPSIQSTPTTSESSTSSLDEQQPEIHDHYGRDAQKRLRIFPSCSSPEHSAPFCTVYPYKDANDATSAALDRYDSPSSYTSSSSPAPSDQSPCALDFPVGVQITHTMCSFGSTVYVPQPAIHHPYPIPVGSYPDRPAQGYPIPYSEAVYGRQVPHGIPAYSDDNGYAYTPCKY